MCSGYGVVGVVGMEWVCVVGMEWVCVVGMEWWVWSGYV